MASGTTFQVIRIAALLAVIFAAGLVTGRFTAPETDPAPMVVEPAPRGARVDYAVRTMAREFEFDAQKEARFRVLMDRMERDMHPLARGSAERRDLWRDKYVPEIRTFIPEHLMDKFDAQVRRTERRFERMIRQRERAEAGEAETRRDESE